MQYENTKYNIAFLLRTLGHMRIDQITKFFRDVPNAARIPIYIRSFVGDHQFDIDSSKTIVSYHKTPKFSSDNELWRYLESIWFLVDFPSSEILDICQMQGPTSYLFLTKGGDCYDVSYIRSLTDAQYTRAKFLKYLPKSGEDLIKHIAVVPDEDLGDDMFDFGFSGFCTIDADHNPKLVKWE